MSLLSLNRAEVEELLPMAECIEAVEAALRSLARREAVQPLRSAHWMPLGIAVEDLAAGAHAYRKAVLAGGAGKA